MSLSAKHIEMVDDCMERDSLLSDWETDFLDKMSFLLAAGKSLTPGQEEKLEEVWEKVTDEMPTIRRKRR